MLNSLLRMSRFFRPQWVFTDFKETLHNEEELRASEELLERVTSRSMQLYRANHGGGMPCPEGISSKPSMWDNL